MSGGRERFDWVDTFRGLAIILVVAGHVLGGITYTPDLREDAPLRPVYDWIYSFHMPAFFWASGLFVERSVRRPGLRGFVWNKAATLLYPFFLWGVLGWVIHQAVGRYANSVAGGPETLLELPFNPDRGPWFLYVLFELMVVNVALRAVGIGRYDRFVVAVGAWAAWVASGVELPPALAKPAAYGIYVALGELTFDAACRLVAGPRPLTAVLGAIGFAVVTAAVALGWRQVPALAPVPAIAGTAGLVGLAGLLAGVRPVAWLQLCGRYSLEIYLLHPYPSVLARVLLLKVAGIAGWPTHAVVGTLAGVGGSLVGGILAKPLRCEWLFRLPERKRVPSVKRPDAVG